MLNFVSKNFQFLKLTFFTKRVRSQILSKKNKEGIKNEKILFCPSNSTILNLLRESIIGAACEKKGAKVSYFMYDLYPGAIDFLHSKPKIKYKIYYALGRFFYKTNKLSFHLLSNQNPYKNESEIKKTIDSLTTNQLEEFKYKGISVGRYAVASSIRHYLSPFPLWDNPNFVKWVRDFIFTGCVIADGFSNLLENEKPDKIVMSHAIYISWGVLFDVARKKSIDVDVYNSSYKENTLRFYKNAPNSPFPIAEWPKFADVNLTGKELEILNRYIESRTDQKDDSISLFSGESDYSDVDLFIKKGKEKGAKIACLFSNISWDAFAFSNDCPFGTMEDWIVDSIKYLSENPNIYVIVKAHPAEIFHKVPENFRVKSIIPKDLPENILFVNEHANIKPFYLYDKIDFGIIHISTVSIEMALKNIPVLTSGAESHYSNKNFTIDPTSKEEYFNILKSLCEGKYTFSPNIEIAKKYMYYRFFREAIPFDALKIKNGKYSIPDGEMNKFKGIETIADGITDNKTFIFDWAE
jgi:hypothetical protein